MDMDSSDEIEVATITVDAVIIDQIVNPIKFDKVSCAMTAQKSSHSEFLFYLNY